MAARNVTRNNLIAGTFLLLALIAGIVISVVISGGLARLTPRHDYTVRFPIELGAHGLREGSDVHLGGQPIGWVQRMDFYRPANIPEAVEVHITVQADIVLYRNAIVHLQRPLLGAMSTVNIASPGDPSHPRLQPGEVIDGALAPPALMAQAGLGDEQIQNMQAALRRLDRFTLLLEEHMEEFLADFGQILNNVRSMTESVEKRIPEWEEGISEVLAEAREVAQSMGPLARNAQETLEDARGFLLALQDTVDENRENFSQITVNMRDTSERINEMIPTVEAGIEQFAATGRAFEAMSGEAESLLMGFQSVFVEQVPNIRRTLANFRLASDQARIAISEVRRQPWRLMHRPARRELEREVFYDAVRTYAEALSDLREASESLEAVLHAEAVGRIAPTVHVDAAEDVRIRLEEARRRFEEAERLLFEEIQRMR